MRYCPDRAVTRAQMATLLVRALDLVSESVGLFYDEPIHLVDGSLGAGWSPDGGRLVYSQDGALWTMDADGSDRSLLVARVGGEFFSEPAWSPDGTRIAYMRASRHSDGHWFSHIYSVSVDGTGRVKLSGGDVLDSRPGWSPDSERIVFQRISGTSRDNDGNYVDVERLSAVSSSTEAAGPPRLRRLPLVIPAWHLSTHIRVTR